MQNEAWYYVVNKTTKVALDYMQLPETWGRITGMSLLSDAQLKDFSWAQEPDIAFVKKADAVAMGINVMTMDAAKTAAKDFFIEYVTEKVQDRLDDFAQQRGYDGILSAASYATSKVAKFAAEGQKCVDLRDSTWAALYEYLNMVEDGLVPAPESYAEIEPVLPVLSW